MRNRWLTGGPREPDAGGRRIAPRAGRPLFLCALLLCGSACGKSRPETVDVSSQPGDGDRDGGAGGHGQSPRPDAGPLLPTADSEVVVPFGGKPVAYRIDIAADPGVLDVQLSIDATASIGPEIDALQRDLERKVVPDLHERVANVSFGVSKFMDFPLPPFGAGPDQGGPDTPFVLLTPITSSVSRVANAVAALDQPLGNGGDLPEAGAEALWQIATGKGYELDGETLIEPFDPRVAHGSGSAGGVGFREGALRVVLHVTDAPSHAPAEYGAAFPDTHSISAASKALQAIDAKLVAIVSGACAARAPKDCDAQEHADARAQLERIALATGALGPDPATKNGPCPNGIDGADVDSVDGHCPLVFDVDSEGRGLTDTLIDAIAGLVDAIRFDAVTGSASDDPIGFVAGVVPVLDERERDIDAPELADLLPEGEADGELDSFVKVRAKTKLRFEVELQNHVIAPTDVDQTFRVVVQVKGDGLILQEKTLRVVVPKGTRLAPEHDSASDDDAGS
jgi:hypothetical protein